MTTEPHYASKGAIFSPDRKYRYQLWRVWDTTKKPILFIMLNPSTADERVLDPTVRRCLGYAMRWGYGQMDICNLFALRSTNPMELYRSEDPVGVDNDEHILVAAKSCDKIIAAWGNHGGYNDRSVDVLNLLTDPIDYPVYALAITKDNQPVHPLYQKGDLLPRRYI